MVKPIAKFVMNRQVVVIIVLEIVRLFREESFVAQSNFFSRVHASTEINFNCTFTFYLPPPSIDRPIETGSTFASVFVVAIILSFGTLLHESLSAATKHVCL